MIDLFYFIINFFLSWLLLEGASAVPNPNISSILSVATESSILILELETISSKEDYLSMIAGD